MRLIKHEEIPLQPGEVQKDGPRPVRALYQVTKGGQKTRSGDTYDYPSIKRAADSAHLQEEIRIGALFGYLGHPPDLIDRNGKNWGSNPWTNPKIFNIESLWADDADEDAKAWVRYLPNEPGLKASDAIREGKELAVSMVSWKRCDDDRYCEILSIQNFDQVNYPNMPTAVLLAHKDGADHDCGCYFNPDKSQHCNDCKNSAGVSRPAIVKTGDAYMKLNYKDAKEILNKDQLAVVSGKDMMNLDQILGQAKGYGGLTSEGIVWLEYWCAAVKDMQEQITGASSADAASHAAVIAEMTADSQAKLEVIGKVAEAMKARAAVSGGRDAAILNGAADQVAAFRAAAAGAQPGTSPQAQHDSAMTALQQQVSAIATTVNAFIDTHKQQQAQKDADAQKQADAIAKRDSVKKAIDDLFAGDTITFGAERKDDAVVYQKKSFHADAIQAVKDGAMKADTPEAALAIAEIAMDSLSKAGAATFLKDKGFPGVPQADAGAKGKSNTSGGSNVGSKSIYDHPIISKMKDADLAYRRQHDHDGYMRAMGRDSKIVKEKKADLLKDNMPGLEKALARADQAYEQVRASGKDSWEETNWDDLIKQFPVGFNKDSFDQALTNAEKTVILPYFSIYMRAEQYEPMDAMNLYSGITRNALVSGLPPGSDGWGRVYSYGQEFRGNPTGNDPYVQLDSRGTGVFEELNIFSTRQEFVAEDFGLLVRMGRGDMMCLRSDVPAYDQLARLKYWADQYLASSRNARMYRALFDAADQVGAISRSESVQNVAPSGTGPRDFIGEFAQKTGDAAVPSIGGKVFGGVGSNIGAVIRVRGSRLVNGTRTLNTTGSAYANVPIARNYTKPTHSQAGVISNTQICPASLTINGVTKTQGSLATVNGVQMIVPSTAHYAIDQEGFFVLAEDAGHTSDPTSPAIVTSFYEVTNFIRMNMNPDLEAEEKFFNKKLYQFADQIAIIRSAPNFGMADTVLCSDRNGTNFAKASKFDKDESPNGTNLNPFDNTWNRLSYRGINFVSTVDPLPFGNGRSLILQNGYAGMAAWMGEFSQPYRPQETDLLTGKQKILTQLVMDTMSQDCLGVPIMTYPTGHPRAGQTVNFPFCNVIHYGTLPSETD